MPDNKKPSIVRLDTIDHFNKTEENNCNRIRMGDDKFPHECESEDNSDSSVPQCSEDRFDMDIAAMHYSLLSQVTDVFKDISYELNAYREETDFQRKEILALRRYEATLERLHMKLDSITEYRQHEIIIEKFKRNNEEQSLFNASKNFKVAHLLNSMALSVEECKRKSVPYKTSLLKIWRSSEFRQKALGEGINIHEIDQVKAERDRILMIVNRRPKGGLK
jgi:hypothetical protein